MAQDIAFARRPRQLNRYQINPCARRIISAEINCLSYFGKRIGDSLARLLNRNGHQPATVFLQQIGQAIKAIGTDIYWGSRPSGIGCERRSHRICRIKARIVVQFQRDRDFGSGCLQYGRIVQIDTAAIHALWLKQVSRRGNRGMTRSAHRHDLFNWVSQQFVFTDRLIGQLMDKAAVRTIFQQTAYEIGQQITVATDGRIRTAMIAILAHQTFEQALTHAVQALKFKIALFARPLKNRRDCQRIVRCKCRTDIARGEHIFGTGEIGYICCRLSRKQRKVRQPSLLRMFDFAIPIGALHQTNLHDARRIAAQCVSPSKNGAGTLGISLNSHTKSFPT